MGKKTNGCKCCRGNKENKRKQVRGKMDSVANCRHFIAKFTRKIATGEIDTVQGKAVIFGANILLQSYTGTELDLKVQYLLDMVQGMSHPQHQLSGGDDEQVIEVEGS